MTEFFVATDLPQRMDQGPLACIAAAYVVLLSQQGFTQQYARLQLRFLSDLNQWLLENRLQISDLSKSTLQQYLRFRHKRFRPRRDDQAILNRLLQLLQTQGFLPKETPDSQPLVNPHQSLEEDFDRYLAEERGLSMATRINYRPFVQRFLAAQFGIKPFCSANLNAQDVIRFIQNQAPDLSPKRAGLMVSALRSFFRYLRYRGDITIDLAACVPPIANWQFTSLPKFLQPQQVQQVLSQCDRHTARGRRDYAILLLLARLGLRACEIVSMTLDDIHWQAGEITIRGKGKRIAQLPLPPDVGTAIADYLKKDHRACSTRHVFICTRAPRRGFSGSQAISTIVARALKRANIDSPYRGAHLFRHTLATEMLKQGSSLGDIGLLLRHRSLNTTTLYAKVDLMALRTLAQPWPGGVL
jgi:site-specific recombinase XerD